MTAGIYELQCTGTLYREHRVAVPFVATINENKYRKIINQITHLISVKDHVFFLSLERFIR